MDLQDEQDMDGEVLSFQLADFSRRKRRETANEREWTLIRIEERE